MSRLRLLACGAAALLLCACVGRGQRPDTLPREIEAQWTTHSSALRQLQGYALQGRIASGGAFGLSGSLRWTQSQDDFQMHLAGPFGAGAVAIGGRPGRIEVQTREGSAVTDDPEGWIREKTGWSLPLAGLRWWVLGLPSPASEARLQLDAQGLPLTLAQDGWQIEYREYQEVDGLRLPRKLEALHQQARIRLVIDRWTGLAASPPPS